MALTSSEIINKIETKEFLMLDVPQGRYYASKKGIIYSLNKIHPRIVLPTQQSTGEFYIALYVPILSVFNLAELLLKTFVSHPEKGQVPCYQNNDLSDLSIANLYWGDQTQRNYCLSLQSLQKSKELAHIVSNVPNQKDYQTLNYYCNKSFLIDLFGFMLHLSRSLIAEDLCTEDKAVVVRAINDIGEIISMAVLKFDRIERIFSSVFENEKVSALFAEYKLVLIKNRKAYCSL